MIQKYWQARAALLNKKLGAAEGVRSLAKQVNDIRYFFMHPSLFSGEYVRVDVLTEDQTTNLQKPVMKSSSEFPWIIQTTMSMC